MSDAPTPPGGPPWGTVTRAPPCTAVDSSSSTGRAAGRPRRSPNNSSSPAPPCTSGSTGSAPRAGPGSKTAPPARTALRPAPHGGGSPDPRVAHQCPARASVPGRAARAGRRHRRPRVARHGVAPLAATDPITGEPVRRHPSGVRYERRAPGDLLHVDVKKLGRVARRRPVAAARAPRGRPRPHGPWPRARLRLPARRRGRPLPAGLRRAHPDERDATCAGFLHRAVAWFRAHGVRVLRVLTDNAKVYPPTNSLSRAGRLRRRAWAATCRSSATPSTPGRVRGA